MDRIIKNELTKLFKEKKFYVTTLLTILIGVGAILISKKMMPNSMNFVTSLSNYSTGVSIVLVYWIIILFSDIITEEYKAGTMKLSLISTVTRTEYIIAKLVFGLVTLVLMVTISFLAGVITSGILFKFGTVAQIFNMFTRYISMTIPTMGFGAVIMILAILLGSGGVVIASGVGLTMLLGFIPLQFKWFEKYEITSFAGKFLSGDATASMLSVSFAYIFVGTLISVLIFKKKDIRT